MKLPALIITTYPPHLRPVVLLDGEQPPAEGVVIYVKAREESEVGEHSDDALKLKGD